MNLAELITFHRTSYEYNGYQFTNLQTLLYETFVAAMEDNRTILVPSRSLPRQSGKTIVLQKLSSQYGLPVLRGSEVFYYNNEGGSNRVRINDFRGTRDTHVLIDEPTQFHQADARRAFGLPCIGYRNFEIGQQPLRSMTDIEAIDLEVEQLMREGNVYEYHRENQNPRNQRIHNPEFDAAWRWEAIGDR
jgi:hypothetical protein